MEVVSAANVDGRRVHPLERHDVPLTSMVSGLGSQTIGGKHHDLLPMQSLDVGGSGEGRVRDVGICLKGSVDMGQNGWGSIVRTGCTGQEQWAGRKNGKQWAGRKQQEIAGGKETWEQWVGRQMGATGRNKDGKMGRKREKQEDQAGRKNGRQVRGSCA
ncbi:hypothetical protein BDQ17DRAFT_1434071 [Cyathus striatus]|nr:hypothetical protein BDQ17DRAFT_1434071 [Cyathus striatus]